MKESKTTDIDFHKYFNPEVVKYYDVFIGPNGEYYKVKDLLDNKDLRTHYIWAKEFMIKHHLWNKLLKEKIDPLIYLIDKYGYIRYSEFRFSRNPIVDVPKYSSYGTCISQKQVDSVYNLLIVKEEYLTEEQKEELEKALYGINKNDMSDYYFTKRIKSNMWR